MTFRRAFVVVLACAAGVTALSGAAVFAQEAKPAPKSTEVKVKKPGDTHVFIPAADIKWGPAPESLPAGAQMAVLDGDPAKAGVPFTIAAKFPDGYRIAPHWHPTVENVQVVSGSFLVGVGDTADEKSMKALGPGGYAKMPARMHHYAASRGETVIHVYGRGPFAVTYVNPSDDPRKKKPTTQD
jgi:hypothetical protein